MRSDDFQSYEEVSTAFYNPEMPCMTVGSGGDVLETRGLPDAITLRLSLTIKQYDHFPKDITLKDGDQTYIYKNKIHTRYELLGEAAHFVCNIMCKWTGEGSQVFSQIVAPLKEGLLTLTPGDVVYDKPFAVWPKDIHESRVFDEKSQSWTLLPYKISEGDVYFPVGGVYVKNLPFSTIEACYGRVSITDDAASLITMTHSEFVTQETPVPLSGEGGLIHIDTKKEQKIYMMSHGNEEESLSLRGALCKGLAKISCVGSDGTLVTYRSYSAHHGSEDYSLLDVTFMAVGDDK